MTTLTRAQVAMAEMKTHWQADDHQVLLTKHDNLYMIPVFLQCTQILSISVVKF